MKSTYGTPDNLYDAIDNALIELEISEDRLDSKSVRCIKEHIKDFLSQKFNIAMLTNEQQEKMLLDLFTVVTK